MKRRSSIPLSALLLAAGIGCVTIVLATCTEKTVPTLYRDEQVAAAGRMEQAELFLKEQAIDMGIVCEDEDLNHTYLLGPEFTELTSTPGNPDAKRTALDPNFAAAIVRWFHKAGLQRGDAIAIGTSGSFPGFVIATLCAASEMGLDTRVIASLGASMHGGTRVEFNIFTIIRLLQEGGFINVHVLGVSPGGLNDQGGSVLEDILYTGTKELSKELCEESGYPTIFIDDLAENIQYRKKLYGGNIRLFVNIGGASTNMGKSSYTLNFPQGLVLDPPTIPTSPVRGLIYEYAADGVPVLNMLNVRLLAQENGIPYDPVPLTKPGEGGACTETKMNRLVLLAGLLLVLLVLVRAKALQTRKQSAD